MKPPLVAGLVGLVALLCVAVVLLVVVDGDDGDAVESGSDTQTWQVPYAVTSCAQWASAMTPTQRSAAAAELLTHERVTVDADAGEPPPDALVEAFEDDISSVCRRDPTDKVSEAAFVAYDEDPGYRP